ncbi:MAG: aminotransferase class V-fold PLP-dependent enzyme, partial [Bdellovibrionota bacterium]
MTPTASPQTDRVYLDHNATSPIAMRVRERVPQWLELWGNPSSIHQSGRGPKTLMRDSREKIANFLGANPLELVFTSGGAEANNLALKGVFETFQAPELYGREFRHRYLISSVEHPSVRKAAESLRSRGAVVELIPVLRTGAIDLEAYAKLLTDETALVSVMLANNETGVIHPIKEMAALAHGRGALFHTDGVQALGKLEFSLAD